MLIPSHGISKGKVLFQGGYLAHQKFLGGRNEGMVPGIKSCLAHQNAFCVESVPKNNHSWARMGFAESSVTKTRGFWSQMGCDLWATLPVEAGNERHSANGGGRSVGLRPGAAGNVESEAGRRPKADKAPPQGRGLGRGKWMAKPRY